MNYKGFTFIELIVVIAIILLLSLGVITNYNNYNDTQRVRQAALTLKSDIRLAQTKASSGQKPAGCDSLESYDVTFTIACDGDKSCYEVVPHCTNGLLDDAKITMYLPDDVRFDAVYPTVRFFSVTANTDIESDLLISITGISKTGGIKITQGGGISEF